MTAALTGSLFGAALQQPAVLAGLALVLVGARAQQLRALHAPLPDRARAARGSRRRGRRSARSSWASPWGSSRRPASARSWPRSSSTSARSSRPALGFALFFALGLGMGAPYVGLAALAGRLRRLPRGGRVARLGGAPLRLRPPRRGALLRDAAPARAGGPCAGAALLSRSPASCSGFVGARERRAPVVRRARRVCLLVALGARRVLGAETREPDSRGGPSRTTRSRRPWRRDGPSCIDFDGGLVPPVPRDGPHDVP